jgi:hypothetical protein
MLVRSSPFLRQALIADAVASGATGFLMLVAAAFLSDLLGLPMALLRWAGAALLPFAVILALLGLRERVPPAAIWAVIAVNGIWAAESILLLLSGWVAPTGLGYAFVTAQALAVAGLAQAQYLGLRGRRGTAAA